ncbi:MAG TPA: glutathione synthase [Candidatus Eisenbacteria bacterium]|nr:glutathione synthase [Candidatus Eisenbacteria bacterium]
MKIAFLLYPVSKVKVDEDTSFWIMHELSRRGHQVFHFESRDLFWRDGSVWARVTRSRTDVRKGFLGAERRVEPVDLGSLDCVFIRKEPPFDAEYLYALQLLETIKSRTFVLNDPAGIAMSNEKLFILDFPRHIPETLVTGDPAEAARFARSLGRAVIKRLDEKGGLGIFSTSSRDRNLPSLLEQATRFGREKVMVQRFVSADRHGDKRILLLNGEILGAFLRRPSALDFRANLGVGGTLHRAAVTASDRKVVRDLSPVLEERGLHFVGIDLIGRFLTEINVTSPAGIADLITLYQRHAETKVADFIEARAGAGRLKL